MSILINLLNYFMRYTGPKARRARRLGMAFTAKDARILQKRGYAPGQHGQNRARLSEYALQLREKQKAKVAYGVAEKQFESYFNRALKRVGVTGDILLQLLESRLDNVVFRLGFAETRAQARQLVSHGFFEVNGKKVDIPSYHAKVGDLISMREVKRKSGYTEKLKDKLKGAQAPEWMQLEAEKLSGKILSAPIIDQTSSLINTQLIVEHYSRT
jgi:small subunit ribosomal protein S4